mgnify:CR=1 FL=1
MCGTAAVDVDDLAGDVGCVEDEEFHGAGDVGRAADALEQGVLDDGRPLGRAAFSPHSQIRARLWTFDADEAVDHAFFKRRVAAAVAARAVLPELRGQEGLCPAANTLGMRLIHGESDGLPGVIADRYGETVVLQLNSVGAEKWRDAIVAALLPATGCTRVFERSDAEVRGLEGLEARSGSLHGGEPAGPVVIEEHGIRFEVDIRGGHKTGFYLDQRENRSAIAAYARGAEVLNCFSYTGGFGVAALAAGAARVTNIDSSAPALELSRRIVELNGIEADRVEHVEGVGSFVGIDASGSFGILPGRARFLTVLEYGLARYAKIDGPRQYLACPGGVLYLAIILLGIFGEAFVRGTLVVSGDATATANAIAASGSLWRVGIAGDLLGALEQVAEGIVGPG